MAIYYDEVRKQFVLENKNTHYSFFCMAQLSEAAIGEKN